MSLLAIEARLTQTYSRPKEKVFYSDPFTFSGFPLWLKITQHYPNARILHINTPMYIINLLNCPQNASIANL